MTTSDRLIKLRNTITGAWTAISTLPPDRSERLAAASSLLQARLDLERAAGEFHIDATPLSILLESAADAAMELAPADKDRWYAAKGILDQLVTAANQAENEQELTQRPAGSDQHVIVGRPISRSPSAESDWFYLIHHFYLRFESIDERTPFYKVYGLKIAEELRKLSQYRGGTGCPEEGIVISIEIVNKNDAPWLAWDEDLKALPTSDEKKIQSRFGTTVVNFADMYRDCQRWEAELKDHADSQSTNNTPGSDSDWFYLAWADHDIEDGTGYDRKPVYKLLGKTLADAIYGSAHEKYGLYYEELEHISDVEVIRESDVRWPLWDSRLDEVKAAAADGADTIEARIHRDCQKWEAAVKARTVAPPVIHHPPNGKATPPPILAVGGSDVEELIHDTNFCLITCQSLRVTLQSAHAIGDRLDYGGSDMGLQGDPADLHQHSKLWGKARELISKMREPASRIDKIAKQCELCELSVDVDKWFREKSICCWHDDVDHFEVELRDVLAKLQACVASTQAPAAAPLLPAPPQTPAAPPVTDARKDGEEVATVAGGGKDKKRRKSSKARKFTNEQLKVRLANILEEDPNTPLTKASKEAFGEKCGSTLARRMEKDKELANWWYETTAAIARKMKESCNQKSKRILAQHIKQNNGSDE